MPKSIDISRKRWKRRLTPARELFYSFRNSIYSDICKNAVQGYWYQENNFGDQLTPDILRYYGFRPLFTPIFDACEIVSVGSILEVVPESFNGKILGAGFLLSATEKIFPESQILAVRGKLTAQKLLLPDSVALGDPGILVDKVYKRQISGIPKKYVLGLVPHYKEVNIPSVRNFVKKNPNDVCLINVCRKPEKVIREIAACKNIVSSSLHGLVVSHSLGISACPLTLSGKLRGGVFKFKDYYSAYDVEPVFHKLSGNESLKQLCGLAQTLDQGRVAEVKEKLHSVFLNYASGQL